MGERHPPPSAPPPPVGLIYSASLYPPNLKVMRLEAKAGWAGRATRRGHAAIFFWAARALRVLLASSPPCRALA